MYDRNAWKWRIYFHIYLLVFVCNAISYIDTVVCLRVCLLNTDTHTHTNTYFLHWMMQTANIVNWLCVRLLVWWMVPISTGMHCIAQQFPPRAHRHTDNGKRCTTYNLHMKISKAFHEVVRFSLAAPAIINKCAALIMWCFEWKIENGIEIAWTHLSKPPIYAIYGFSIDLGVYENVLYSGDIHFVEIAQLGAICAVRRFRMCSLLNEYEWNSLRLFLFAFQNHFIPSTWAWTCTHGRHLKYANIA